MAHIQLPEGLPGIRGAMAFRPETAKPLNELVEILLRGPNSLTPGERELIATQRMIVTTVRRSMARLRRPA
jgi:alkylhydroperoxidase family enzyme